MRDLRRAAGMTRLDLAREAGVSITIVQNYEAGVLPARHGSPGLVAVCRALGVAENEVREGAGS